MLNEASFVLFKIKLLEVSMDASVVSLKKVKLLPFIFFDDKAEELVISLYNSYTKKAGLYHYENASTAPQNKHIPGMKISTQGRVFDEKIHRCVDKKFVEAGSWEHVLWLFFATLTDRRQISDEVYKAHVRIFNEHKDFYAERVTKLNKEDFGELLASRYKIGVPRQSAAYWIRCAETLFKDFDGDPIKLINFCGGTVEGIQMYKKRVERKTGFDPLPGYGPKISSLFLLFLAELSVYEMPKDAFPVDVHVQALFLQYGAVVPTRDIVNDELEDFLRNFICKTANENNLCKVALSHAFWVKGAKLCTGCSKRKDVHLLCGIEKDCSGRVNTKEYFSKGIWNYPLNFMRKGCSREFSIEKGSLFD